MRISNKREFLARQLGAVGVIGVLERVARRAGLLVVTYHRLGDPATSPFYDRVYSASPEAFGEQVRHVQDRFRLLSLDEVRAAAEEGFALREPCALITFDDGYRDNLDTALPILRELGAPAAFFIPTGFFDRPRLSWWDHVAYVVKRTQRSRIVLDQPAPLVLDFDQTDAGRDAALMAIIRAYQAAEPSAEAVWLPHLDERAEVAVDDAALGREVFLGWDGVRALAEAGMGIGSHSRDHRSLPRLPDDELRDELAASKQALEAHLGQPITALAYPYGEPDHIDARTIRLAREVGYRLAFTARGGMNRPGRTEAMTVARVNVGYHDSPRLVRARTALCAAFGASVV